MHIREYAEVVSSGRGVSPAPWDKIAVERDGCCPGVVRVTKGTSKISRCFRYISPVNTTSTPPGGARMGVWGAVGGTKFCGDPNS